VTSRLLALLLLCLAALAACLPSEAAQALGPQYFDYQVVLPPAPASAAEALATLDAREQAVISTIACGSELAYAQDSLAHEAGEDTTARVLAKVEWGAGHPGVEMQPRVSVPCQFSVTLRWGDFDNQQICTLLHDAASCSDPTDTVQQGKIDAAADAIWADVAAGKLDTLKNGILEATIPELRSCISGSVHDQPTDRSILAWRLLDPFPPSGQTVTDRRGAVQIDFAISQPCLLQQAARSLSGLVIPVKDGKQEVAGTDGGPCHLFGKVFGDWDMAERNLIRIAYMIKNYRLDQGATPLHDAYATLRSNLLTLDRGPESDSHNVLFGCGNDPGHTGSAEDRATDRADTGKSIGDALGDLAWFLLLLAFVLALAAAIAAALVALGVAGAIAAAVAAAIVLGTIFVANIPETENHLLAINSTKYLNNQLIIEDLGNDITLTGAYIKDQIALKAWLLKRMQTYLQNDFIEYNSRPYQRHAIESIRNIHDFAGDPGRPTLPDADLRNAAELVLDYTAAKFAIGSSQSRRMVPYRRHRSDFAKAVDVDASGWNGQLDLASSADHQVGLGLLYAGQTQQLPLGQGSRGFAGEVIDAATSFYVPEPTILDLAIVKDVPIYQRMHHTTEELYSTGKGFLISAGGLATGLAYPVTGIPAFDDHVDDWGSGVPTTLILTGDPQPGLSYLATAPAPGATDPKSLDQQIFQLQLSLAGFGRAPPIGPAVPFDTSLNGIYAAWLDGLHPGARIRATLGEFVLIKGEFHLDIDSDGTREPTYDNNLCVWDGFACGTNIELGPMATDCAASTTLAPWTFIDSQQCLGRETAPRVFIALFKKDCPASQNCTNYGFYEVIDADQYAAINPPAPGEDLFVKFRDQIANANTVLAGMPAGPNMVSDYHSAHGQTIEFSCWGHESGGDYWGVFHVNGIATHKLGAWPFAGGEWTSSGTILRPDVRTPMTGAGDGTLQVTSPRLKSLADPTKARVLLLDFSDRDHPKAPVEN
jgi:hypothetical protein